MRWIFRIPFEILGWKVAPGIPPEMRRCVLVAAPHTSNWDFILGMGGFHILGIPVRFAIKKEWMIFPFDRLLLSLGAVPIDRSPRKGQRPSMVEAMAELFQHHQDLCLVITPEGTRSRRTEWKTGFYYVALKAKVPIVLGFLDYRRKIVGATKVLWPSGNLAEDMAEIMDFYRQFHPKYPRNFSLDLRYVRPKTSSEVEASFHPE